MLLSPHPFSLSEKGIILCVADSSPSLDPTHLHQPRTSFPCLKPSLASCSFQVSCSVCLTLWDWTQAFSLSLPVSLTSSSITARVTPFCPELYLCPWVWHSQFWLKTFAWRVLLELLFIANSTHHQLLHAVSLLKLVLEVIPLSEIMLFICWLLVPGLIWNVVLLNVGMLLYFQVPNAVPGIS